MQKKFLLMGSIALITGISLLIWGFLIEPARLTVRSYEIKLKKWSPALNGTKIVAVSDLHAGSNFIDEEKLRRLVTEINAQKPDIIVLLGDYVSFSFTDSRKIKMPVRAIAENLRGLEAAYGVYAIFGNTDEAYDKTEIRTELEKTGIKVLRDEIVSLEIRGEPLRLLGMKDEMGSGDWSYISAELKKIAAQPPARGRIIALVHNPDYLPVISGDLLISEELTLVLAGHTHGGQCRFPLIGAPIVPSEYRQKYAVGHLREQEIDMFVTTGIGTSKFPVRFGVPPEISVLIISAE